MTCWCTWQYPINSGKRKCHMGIQVEPSCCWYNTPGWTRLLLLQHARLD
eukprot:jgi/Mesvir1/7042/Mv26520-RA.1